VVLMVYGWCEACCGGGSITGSVWRPVIGVVWCRYVIRLRRLQVWRYLFHSRLILLQRTPGSFVVVRIVVVVVVRVDGRGASDFACLVDACLSTGAIYRGGWFCLGEEAGVLWVVILLGGCLCYSSHCSSSLALVCVFWVVKVFRVFGGSGSC